MSLRSDAGASAPTPLRFYFAEPDLCPLPATLDDFASWQRDIARKDALLGPASWTVQTCLQLRHRGFDCELVTAEPDEGIVLAHRDHMPTQPGVRPNRFWVCLQADRPSPHPYAQFHVLQNPYQQLRFGQPFAYMPHWPQPGLLPRDPSRGNAVRTVRFFGEACNLAPELADPTFSAWCADHGLEFSYVPRDRWHDYSDCDVVLAVRSFDTHALFADKPATKLFNAWAAEVPALLGTESAFRAEGRRGRDYVEVATLDQVKQELMRLASTPRDYADLVGAGRESAVRFTPDAISTRWIALLTGPIFERARHWRQRTRLGMTGTLAAGRIRAGFAWRGWLVTTSN